MGIATLESLTNELFEQVIQHLHFHDACNLRLASRLTAFKAAQETYRSYFREKHVELRKENLGSFAKVTSKGGVGCLVEHLSLVGVVYDPRDLQLSIKTGRPLRRPGNSEGDKPAYTPEELEAVKHDLVELKRRYKEDGTVREQGTDLILLREALSHIATSKKSPLKSLSFRIKIHCGDTTRTRRRASLWNSRQLFQVATHTYGIGMQSLCSSQLQLQALDGFYNLSTQVECSLPCDSLASLNAATIDRGSRLNSCLSTLKSFSIAITDPLIAQTKYDSGDINEESDTPDASKAEQCVPDTTLSRDKIENEKNYSALSELLEICPFLEELSIVGYRLDCSDAELARIQEIMRNRYMHYLARAPSFPQLRKICLADMTMLDTDLLTFLRSQVSSLRELDLNGIVIPERSFSSIASYVTSREIPLEAIRLEDILEGDSMISFRCDREAEGVEDWLECELVKRRGIEQKGDMDYFSGELDLGEWPSGWEWTLEEQTFCLV